MYVAHVARSSWARTKSENVSSGTFSDHLVLYRVLSYLSDPRYLISEYSSHTLVNLRQEKSGGFFFKTLPSLVDGDRIKLRLTKHRANSIEHRAQSTAEEPDFGGRCSRTIIIQLGDDMTCQGA